MSTVVVYKVCSRSEWAEARRTGRYAGSADDLRDGFIHLSTAGQLAKTLARHFAGMPDLLLIAFEAASLGAALRWEPARDGQLFPHLYGDLDPSLACSQHALSSGADGTHILPEGLP